MAYSITKSSWKRVCVCVCQQACIKLIKSVSETSIMFIYIYVCKCIYIYVCILFFKCSFEISFNRRIEIYVYTHKLEETIVFNIDNNEYLHYFKTLLLLLYFLL